MDMPLGAQLVFAVAAIASIGIVIIVPACCLQLICGRPRMAARLVVLAATLVVIGGAAAMTVASDAARLLAG